MATRNQLQTLLHVTPLIDSLIDGETPLQAQQFLLDQPEYVVPPLPDMLLAFLFAGSCIAEGRANGRATDVVAGFCVLVPKNCVTSWELSGPITSGYFHFVDAQSPMAMRLLRSIPEPVKPVPFFDALVSATAEQVFNELARGAQTNTALVRRLADMLLEQVCRVLEGLAGRADTVDPLQISRVNTAVSWISEHLAERITVADLAEHAGISQSHFGRIFAEAMGCTPHKYIARVRLEKVRELLLHSSLPLADIADRCGFESQSHLHVCFRRAYGLPPARFRRQTLS